MRNDKIGRIPLLVLVGPTAVGKSQLALKISDQLNTDIISADSAQVYRRLNIGTAKPTREEQKKVKHHLIDIIEPDHVYSVADYQKDADQIIRKMWQNGKLPFMVGGTGLYIKAVTDRYAFGSKGANHNLRSAYSKLVLDEGLDKLYARLKSIDPAAAEKIHPNDQKRIIRALEVYDLEGKPISGQVDETVKQVSPYNPIICGINMERNLLYRRIEERVDNMIAEGFLDEVKDLFSAGYDLHSPGMQILGYKQLLGYLHGDMGWEETIAEIKKQTRNLAKRQLTWFRREKQIVWFDFSDHSGHVRISENIYLKVKDICPDRANNTIIGNRQRWREPDK